MTALLEDEEESSFTINLDKSYGIDANDYNFTLIQRKTVESGKRAGQEDRRILGYYSRLHDCFNAYMQRSMKQANVKGIEDFKKEIDRLDKTIRSVGKEFLAKFPPRKSQAETNPDVRKKVGK